MQSLDFSVSDYDLKKTLESGQTFHWKQDSDGGWDGVLAGQWVRLNQTRPDLITASFIGKPKETEESITQFLQLDVDLSSVLTSFPNDPLLRQSVESRNGLRLLRQDPWTCLASFILSSNKRIPQIIEVVRNISNRLGKHIVQPFTHEDLYIFPDSKSIASSSESLLRECKAGYRAKYLYQCARLVSSGVFDLAGIHSMHQQAAREKLMELPGVGGKIADCVLLFAYGFPQAFPIDVWVQKVLGDYYFKGKKVSTRSLETFVKDYFGEHAGFAQQYLFDYIRHLSASEWAEWVDRSEMKSSEKYSST